MTTDSRWAIGLMTGTVLDGHIDVAAIRTDGETIEEFGPYELVAYEAAVTPLIEAAVKDALDWQFEGDEPASFAAAERRLSEAQAEAVAGFCERHGLSRRDVAAVGFHGQTVLHRPPEPGVPGRTRQLGDGALMARMLGITVVHDFRSADVAAGGQGAPLSPIYHRAMLERIGAGTETAILNLGGVANLTYCDGETLIAFDTGPANAPINDWIKAHGAGAMDRDGRLAFAGTVDEVRLARLLDHPWLARPYPKSLDRFSFKMAMAEGLSLEDGAATLTAFTAGAVGRALDLLPSRPERLVVCGGGRHNPAIMAAIEARAGAAVVDADAVGLRGDAVEAECFAHLAMRRLADLPISFPLTTGVPRPMTGGVVNRS
ncbi:anhydro-N-acetylmuramic acid kinase [Jiella avicenniae]|uniref:Anhydro-N-acetylmuramic acid kinase n=1 Tax=Jiella avicenniae TaxID=2907202 RepID=A0A9X1NZK2_9HYPH|nr:anhydro-N-acetylmuramic acid kinase [Jiella avicenniae]MCE7027758.1 anhydro-N-acetylmuramic acid kinase [Jiella avicenniae]MCE7028800.1 anhydro-N-acetylmuramic acid kinase [Jiella avicenniae]